jgi:hypothetical protein
VKTLLNLIVFSMVCALMVAQAKAAVTNASWTFPVSTTPAPSQPIGADLSIYSTNNTLAWIAANTRLSESFVSIPGNTTALEFSYNGNHADYLNGSTLTLTSTISGLASGDLLAGIRLSYDTRWSMTASTLTNSWAYSINGGAFIDFATDAATGNVWQTANSPLIGLTLNNGDTITFRDTFSGAVGNNGNLDFDNIQITSIVVPEPPPLTLAVLGISLAGVRRVLWFRPGLPKSRHSLATAEWLPAGSEPPHCFGGYSFY